MIDPQFNLIHQPARIIADSKLRIPVDAKILQQPGKVHIFTSKKSLSNKPVCLEKVKNLTQLGAKIHVVDSVKRGGLNLQQILSTLSELHFNEVLLESGKNLAGSMISANLVDELTLYLAPKLMGSTGRGMFDLMDVEQMQDLKNLTIKDSRMVGCDIRLTLALAG